MSIREVNMVGNRLSLRKPQRESLELLQRLTEIIPLNKNADVGETLEIVKSEFPHFLDFERDFPSLCFALATGVGKTRLMGAFISYLHLARGIRHFFVLAPNLTIYNKLIADFTPNTPKYVFKGIGEFNQTPPLIITGDNYESGIGTRQDLFGRSGKDEVHINIFNISKINSEVRGGNAPRIKRLSEYIGQSYFDYLAELDDLVILMDESHRYRASAGIRAINELKPVLGLELTATPQVESGSKSIPFRNVLYHYPLSSALRDGFIKEPAVATRENFISSNFSEEELEKIKLEDGVCIHENTKAELAVFAKNNDQPLVKPFMLVVAQDTTHAESLKVFLESDDFFEGNYRNKVITVHSNVRGEEKDDVVSQLLTVEHAENPVEIVIHVNMLKEGWDVTNLFTIVPLRTANSRTLVEQSIGRGLRLPYGKRVGVTAVDRLTIVSHDKFQEIVDHAKDPNSIIRVGVIIGKDIPEEGKRAVTVRSNFEKLFAEPEAWEKELEESLQETGETKAIPVFNTIEEKKFASAIAEAIKRFEHLKGSEQLNLPEVQRQIIIKAKEALPPPDLILEGFAVKVDEERIVREVVEKFQEMTIDIPKIVVAPEGEVRSEYKDFDLDVSSIRLQPVSGEILVAHLHDEQRYTLQGNSGKVAEKRFEDYLVHSLMDYDDIPYDEHASLLYKLAGQAVNHLKSYLRNEEEVLNVLHTHRRVLVELIHAQMQKHHEEVVAGYVATVTKGFTCFSSNGCTLGGNDKGRDFRTPVPDGEKNRIPSMLFGGFRKCLYAAQKFDSDPERRFAVILENDEEVVKWLKPSRKVIHIFYREGKQWKQYEPDFVVETKTGKYLCEPKNALEINDETVQEKAKAARTWCEYATAHAREDNGKPWRYLLIPHDQIAEQMNFMGLASKTAFM